MMSARLRKCLKTLRWREAELADASGNSVAEAKAWLDGRVHPPLAVTAWLEALAKAHAAVPPPFAPGSTSQSSTMPGK
jgi:hypothetical protein